MRVLHFGKYYPPHFGGMEYFLRDLNIELNRLNVKSDVICSNDSIWTVEEDKDPGYKLIRTGTFGEIASTAISPAMITRGAKLRDAYDIVHVHLPNPMANLAISLVRPTAKIIVHWHSDIIAQKRLLRYYNPLLRHILNRADAIIATSNEYVKGSSCLKSFKQKIFVIPLGVDFTRLKEPLPRHVSSIKERYGGKSIVFSVGRLTKYKGYEYLIRAARELDDNTVVLIGGDGRLKNDLWNEIEEQGLSEKVVMLGRISDKDIPGYFKACDVFVLPSVSRNEAFGVAQVEAMFYAKPVISTDIRGSGVSWVNRNGESGIIVNPRDAEGLAGAIKKLLDDRVMLKKLSDGASRRANTEFDIRFIAKKIISLYDKTVEGDKC
jgi:rhamnosyl/mannosyltransferase